MTITITAFERSPDGGKGLARDTRVRWALDRGDRVHYRRSLSSLRPGCWRATKHWHKERLPLVEERVRNRLQQLSARLGNADWLDGTFSAGDLMMVSVLLRLKPSGMLDEYPNLAAYVARGEARPAYQRAFAAQLATNTGKPPTG